METIKGSNRSNNSPSRFSYETILYASDFVHQQKKSAVENTQAINLAILAASLWRAQQL